jgi:hypothetical protein
MRRKSPIRSRTIAALGIAVLLAIACAEKAAAELSAVERERLHLCPKNCAPYCEEVPAKPTYCTCFCHAAEPTSDAAAGKNHRPKRKQQR